MSTPDLEERCMSWDGSSDEFARLVAGAVATFGPYQHDLAAEFEVADSTVSRWASGVARPHPKLQKLIVESIRKRAGNAAPGRDSIA